MVHVRFEGRSLDFSEAQLAIATGSTDSIVKDNLARQLDVKPERLRNHIVERTNAGDLIIRPEAAYG